MDHFEMFVGDPTFDVSHRRFNAPLKVFRLRELTPREPYEVVTRLAENRSVALRWGFKAHETSRSRSVEALFSAESRFLRSFCAVIRFGSADVPRLTLRDRTSRSIVKGMWALPHPNPMRLSRACTLPAAFFCGCYEAPFDRCDRERDYEIAWAHFEKRFGESQ